MIKPIAYIQTDFKEKFGIPRQSGRVPEAVGKIIFLPEYRNKDALRGLDEFSHIWIIFDFSLAHRQDWSPTVRPPRLGGNKRVGVFATRSPFRPNNIGLSSVKLLKVDGDTLVVSGVDLLDGTPIYDIKPYIPYTDCHTEAKGSFAQKEQNHSLDVNISEELLNIIPKEKQKTLLGCLKDDPRPSYQNDRRIYTMKFDVFDVSFKVSDNILIVTGIDKL